MECVIIYRNPYNKRVGYVGDGDGDEIMVYRDRDAAERAVMNVPILKAAPYQIVELDNI